MDGNQTNIKIGNIYITICKIDSKWEFTVLHRELNLELCDNLERWDGVGAGRGIQEGGGAYVCLWPIHVDVWQKPTQYCKAIILLCPWHSPGKNTERGCHSLLQGIFLTQELNQGLLHCRQVLYHLSQQSILPDYPPIKEKKEEK